jgi:hypothetical protein
VRYVGGRSNRPVTALLSSVAAAHVLPQTAGGAPLAHPATAGSAVLAATPASLVRAAHVLAAGVLVGGAALLWAALDDAGGDAGTPRLAHSYEWAFWGAAGVLVATGVGNVGAFVPALRPFGSWWGATFVAKPLPVAVLLVGSVGRTVAAADATASDPRWLRRAYGLTALPGGLLVVLAVVLAHG